MSRADKARAIVEAMREVYEREGVAGDFADAQRYFEENASDEELAAEYLKWVTTEGEC